MDTVSFSVTIGPEATGRQKQGDGGKRLFRTRLSDTILQVVEGEPAIITTAKHGDTHTTLLGLESQGFVVLAEAPAPKAERVSRSTATT